MLEGLEADDKTVSVDQGAAATESVDTGVSLVNECGNSSENQADDTVVHSDVIGDL